MKLKLGCIGLVAALSASVATAQEAPPLTGLDVAISVSKGRESDRYYPAKAQKAGVEGKAAALCDVAPNGKLNECKVVEEAPAGCGFGDAALRLTKLLSLAPKAKDGSATAGRTFRFELKLRLPDGEPVRATACP